MSSVKKAKIELIAKPKRWFRAAFLVCLCLPLDSRRMADWLATNAMTVYVKPRGIDDGA
jgi:hypothetical protein